MTIEENRLARVGQNTARELAAEFAKTAAERDSRGGTPKQERDAIRRSGLLALSIPEEFGGLGATWSETLGIVREFAKVDSSIAHVFGFHHLMLASIRLYSRPDQWQPWFEQTASQHAFWGNALNPLDKRTIARSVAGGREFTGTKSFCSGASDSQMLIASALKDDATGLLLIGAVPSDRQGITVHDDWDNMGQRQTDSGSVTFDRVHVANEELLTDPGPLSSPFASLRSLIAQLHFTHIFLGIAEGALQEARTYTRKDSRPWFKSKAVSAAEDPYVLHHYGEFWVGIEGARLLTERAAALLDEAWSKGTRLDYAERAAVAIAVGTAKVSTSRVGLELCSRLFEVTGPRATTAALRLDRYWRNLRTQSLHDPVDYRLQELGEWAVSDIPPTPSFYS